VFNEVKSLSSLIEQLDKDSGLSDYTTAPTSKGHGQGDTDSGDYRSIRESGYDEASAINTSSAAICSYQFFAWKGASFYQDIAGMHDSCSVDQVHSTSIAPTSIDELEIPSWSTSIMGQDVELAAIFGAEAMEAITSVVSIEPSMKGTVERCDEN